MGQFVDSREAFLWEASLQGDTVPTVNQAVLCIEKCVKWPELMVSVPATINTHKSPPRAKPKEWEEPFGSDGYADYPIRGVENCQKHSKLYTLDLNTDMQIFWGMLIIPKKKKIL